MLRGFPADFPRSFDIRNFTKNSEFRVDDDIDMIDNTAIFMRNEGFIEIEAITEPQKRPKVDFENENNSTHDNMNENIMKHVKFSGDPPMEYSTFNDSEYDRSPINNQFKHNNKRYLT